MRTTLKPALQEECLAGGSLQFVNGRNVGEPAGATCNSKENKHFAFTSTNQKTAETMKPVVLKLPEKVCAMITHTLSKPKISLS
jgi:hypothetical protein